MATERVKCIECDNMILPDTAQRNEGLCAQCAQIPPEFRQASRDFEEQLDFGDVFVPSKDELDSQVVLQELVRDDTVWSLDSEYYAESQPITVNETITSAGADSSGNVFLVNGFGSRLNLCFSEQYGVCEFHNEGRGEFLYAYSPASVTKQVEADMQVAQCCPCCGVEVLTFPSRFHMPRKDAFTLMRSILAKRAPDGVRWLDGGDISYVQPGKG